MDELAPDISIPEQDLPPPPEQPEELPPEQDPNNFVPARPVKFKYYGPNVGDRPTRAVMYGPLGRLQPGDVAVSPDLLHVHPIGSYVVMDTPQGPRQGRVADTSWVDEGHPNHNTIEFYDHKPGADSGHVAPLDIQQAIGQVPERAKLAGDQPTAASIENATQAPDIASATPDFAGDIASAAPSGMDAQDIADQVTQRVQDSSSKPTEQIEPTVPTDLNKVDYDPRTQSVSWESFGHKWMLGPGMTKPQELKETPPKIIKDEMGLHWDVSNPKNPQPINLPGNPSEIDVSKIKSGDWDTVPESIRDQAKLYANYKGPSVTGFALRTPYFQKLFQIISKVDPSFNYQEYAKRQKTLADFSSAGKSGQNITSFNTAMDHLGNAMQNSDAMATAMKQGNSPLLNQMHLYGSAITGKGRNEINAYSSDVAALQNEVERATSGAAPHVAGKEAWDKILDPSQPPSARISGMAEQASLMGARLEENRQAYKRAMGGADPNFSFLSPEAETTLQEVIKRTSGTPTGKKVQHILDTFGSQGGKRPYQDPAQSGDVQDTPVMNQAPSQDQGEPYGGRQTVRRLNPDQSNPAEAHVIYDAETKKFLGYEP